MSIFRPWVAIGRSRASMKGLLLSHSIITPTDSVDLCQKFKKLDEIQTTKPPHMHIRQNWIFFTTHTTRLHWFTSYYHNIFDYSDLTHINLYHLSLLELCLFTLSLFYCISTKYYYITCMKKGSYCTSRQYDLSLGMQYALFGNFQHRMRIPNAETKKSPYSFVS